MQLQRLAIASDQLLPPRLKLTQEQHHYLCRVLRLAAGDRFIAMDGQGHWWLAELETETTQAQLLEELTAQNELPIPVLLLVAMPKGNGMDEIVRQATELGVAGIVPVVSDRTLLQPSPQKLDRWRRIVQEAAEQSERQIIPELFSPLAWTEALSRWHQTNADCYLCEARGSYPPLLQVLSRTDSHSLYPHSPYQSNSVDSSAPIRPIVIATGPEGGWTEPEVKAAIAAGYSPVSLGKRVLRAITAPLAALALVAAALEADITDS